MKNGIFYVAIGQDALFLEQKFGERKICFGNNICKCGISIGSIQEFIEKLDVSLLIDFVIIVKKEI